MQIQASENVYWTFSAAAQALAAVVAFLLAGYALVHSMMESRAASDETLLEINDKLSQDYHRQLSFLIVATVAAILADLLVVYMNTGSGASVWLQSVAAALTVLSFAGAVWFVITIVNPGKYKRAARELARRPAAETPGPPASAAAFFSEFVRVEQLLRRLWESQAHGERLSRRPGPPTAREMVESLRMAQALPEDVAGELHALVRTRNLVFHGQLEHVDSDQVGHARWVKEQLERLLGSA